MKAAWIARALRVVLCVIFCAGAATTVSLFFWLEGYLELLRDGYALQPAYRTFLLVFLPAVGVLGLWIVAELVFMLGTVPRDPFVRRNVRALRRVGVVGIVCGMLFFIKCFPYFTLLTLLCGGILTLCGLFSLTLSDLFTRAVAFKEENDMTI